jgi:hypothetical protein
VSLRIPSSSQSPDHDPHRTIYYFGYSLGRFAGLKHRQLARQVLVIITTGQIRRTLVKKIHLLIDSPRSIEASRLALVKVESIFLRRASGCLGTSRGSSRGSSCCSSSTTLPRAGSSSTTSPPPRVRVPRHVARLVTRLVAPLVVDFSASHRLVVDNSASRRLVVDYSASHRLVVDYFASAARPGVSARRAARHAARRATRRQLLYLAQARHRQLHLVQARRRLLHLAQARRRLLRHAQARRRLLHLRRAFGCLGTSHGLSRSSSRRSSSTTPPRAGSSSTTSPPPRVCMPRHVARLIMRLVSPLLVD